MSARAAVCSDRVGATTNPDAARTRPPRADTTLTSNGTVLPERRASALAQRNTSRATLKPESVKPSATRTAIRRSTRSKLLEALGASHGEISRFIGNLASSDENTNHLTLTG